MEKENKNKFILINLFLNKPIILRGRNYTVHEEPAVIEIIHHFPPVCWGEMVDIETRITGVCQTKEPVCMLAHTSLGGITGPQAPCLFRQADQNDLNSQ
jgi:hypothetical protein